MIIDKTNNVRVIYADSHYMLSHPYAFAHPYCRTGDLKQAIKVAREIVLDAESEGFVSRVDVCDLNTGVWNKHTLFEYKNGRVIKSNLLI